jgi:hypothetical protein
MKPIAHMLLLLTLSGCCHLSPAEDYPILPLPAHYKEKSVGGKKVSDGVFLTTAEFHTLSTNITNLRAEIESLRAVIEKYNEWALSKEEPE